MLTTILSANFKYYPMTEDVSDVLAYLGIDCEDQGIYSFAEYVGKMKFLKSTYEAETGKEFPELPNFVADGNKISFLLNTSITFEELENLVKENPTLVIGSNSIEEADDFGMECYFHLFDCFGLATPDITYPSLHNVMNEFLPVFHAVGFVTQMNIPNMVITDNVIHFTSSSTWGSKWTVDDLLDLLYDSRNGGRVYMVRGLFNYRIFYNYNQFEERDLFDLLFLYPECWDRARDQFTASPDQILLRSLSSPAQRLVAMTRLLEHWKVEKPAHFSDLCEMLADHEISLSQACSTTKKPDMGAKKVITPKVKLSGKSSGLARKKIESVIEDDEIKSRQPLKFNLSKVVEIKDDSGSDGGLSDGSLDSLKERLKSLKLISADDDEIEEVKVKVKTVKEEVKSSETNLVVKNEVKKKKTVFKERVASPARQDKKQIIKVNKKGNTEPDFGRFLISSSDEGSEKEVDDSKSKQRLVKSKFYETKVSKSVKKTENKMKAEQSKPLLKDLKFEKVDQEPSTLSKGKADSFSRFFNVSSDSDSDIKANLGCIKKDPTKETKDIMLGKNHTYKEILIRRKDELQQRKLNEELNRRPSNEVLIVDEQGYPRLPELTPVTQIQSIGEMIGSELEIFEGDKSIPVEKKLEETEAEKVPEPERHEVASILALEPTKVLDPADTNPAELEKDDSDDMSIMDEKKEWQRQKKLEEEEQARNEPERKKKSKPNSKTRKRNREKKEKELLNKEESLSDLLGSTNTDGKAVEAISSTTESFEVIEAELPKTEGDNLAEQKKAEGSNLVDGKGETSNKDVKEATKEELFEVRQKMSEGLIRIGEKIETLDNLIDENLKGIESLESLINNPENVGKKFVLTPKKSSSGLKPGFLNPKSVKKPKPLIVEDNKNVQSLINMFETENALKTNPPQDAMTEMIPAVESVGSTLNEVNEEQNVDTGSANRGSNESRVGTEDRIGTESKAEQSSQAKASDPVCSPKLSEIVPGNPKDEMMLDAEAKADSFEIITGSEPSKLTRKALDALNQGFDDSRFKILESEGRSICLMPSMNKSVLSVCDKITKIEFESDDEREEEPFVMPKTTLNKSLVAESVKVISENDSSTGHSSESLHSQRMESGDPDKARLLAADTLKKLLSQAKRSSSTGIKLTDSMKKSQPKSSSKKKKPLREDAEFEFDDDNYPDFRISSLNYTDPDQMQDLDLASTGGAETRSTTSLLDHSISNLMFDESVKPSEQTGRIESSLWTREKFRRLVAPDLLKPGDYEVPTTVTTQKVYKVVGSGKRDPVVNKPKSRSDAESWKKTDSVKSTVSDSSDPYDLQKKFPWMPDSATLRAMESSRAQSQSYRGRGGRGGRGSGRSDSRQKSEFEYQDRFGNKLTKSQFDDLMSGELFLGRHLIPTGLFRKIQSRISLMGEVPRYPNDCYAYCVNELMKQFGVVCKDPFEDGKQHEMLEFWLKLAIDNHLEEFGILSVHIDTCTHCSHVTAKWQYTLALDPNEKQEIIKKVCERCRKAGRQKSLNHGRITIFRYSEFLFTYSLKNMKKTRQEGFCELDVMSFKGDFIGGIDYFGDGSAGHFEPGNPVVSAISYMGGSLPSIFFDCMIPGNPSVCEVAHSIGFTLPEFEEYGSIEHS